tara:strand:+ start:3939 stop:4367 length:429 start_codon:yes stop_codon:yes gene_type:complete
MYEELTCAISGLPAPDTELEIPEGWIKITVERQYINPKWAALQIVKQGLIQQTLASIEEEKREAHLLAVQIQVEAQYALLEDRTEQFFTDIEEVFISPPEESEEIAEIWNGVKESLGLEDEEESEEEEGVVEPTPKQAEEAI